MDYFTPLGIAETDTSLETQVSWHFSSACVPPVPQLMVSLAVSAIGYAVNDCWDKVLELPEGVTWRDLTEVSVRNIIESLHLDAFVESELRKETSA